MQILSRFLETRRIPPQLEGGSGSDAFTQPKKDDGLIARGTPEQWKEFIFIRFCGSNLEFLENA